MKTKGVLGEFSMKVIKDKVYESKNPWFNHTIKILDAKNGWVCFNKPKPCSNTIPPTIESQRFCELIPTYLTESRFLEEYKIFENK